MRCMRYKPNKRAVIIDHVGNVHRFGFPDAEREWKLDAKPVKSGMNGNAVQVRQCTRCFYTHEPSPVCSNCGHVYCETGKRRKIEENNEIQLEKITEKVIAMKSADECSTMKELSMFAKKHNYKPGWCYYQARRLGILK
ncbi:MAG: helicase, partial [Ruminococcus sp.]|nr:helicase [Ruminococcus sp.]